jgi:hypothetical protein
MRARLFVLALSAGVGYLAVAPSSVMGDHHHQAEPIILAQAAQSSSGGAAAAAQTGGVTLLPLSQFGLKEGDVIDENNLAQYSAKLLTPGLEWAVKNGWKIPVTEPKPVSMPRRYREATEKYSGQVKLGEGGVTLQNYVAGQPFPHIDPNDPNAAMKIMWNFYYSFGIIDDLTAKLFEADTGTIAKGQPMQVERHYIIDSLRRLNYNGRIYVQPAPELPNPEGYRYKESLHPILEPFDLKGLGGTFYRYLDPSKQDDSWLYLPQLRRVRRLSTAQRSDALFGQDTDVDSYYGYNGHIAWMNYKLLGERTLLGCLHARNVPVKWQTPEDWLFSDVFEPRPVWVIEAVSKFSQYAYGKRVIFIDKQAWLVPSSDIYDRAGELWKVWVNLFSFKKQAVPNAKVSVYEDEMPFGHAIIMLDTQVFHSTKAALPSTKKQPDEEGIFFNMGEKSGVTEEFFTIAHLIESGH